MPDIFKKSPIAGKKILFFSPAFFGYEEKIKNKMIELGVEVDAFDVRSVTGAFERALLKIAPDLFTKKTESYYAHIYSKIKNRNYDYILIVKCDMPTERVLHVFRKHFKHAKCCLYMWDSMKNIPNVEKKFKYFDYISSFDRYDCMRHPQIRFRPLFYCDEYRKNTRMKEEYDLCFIGTVHSDRWRILKELKKQAEKKGFRVFYYLYLQSKFIYWFYKIVKPEFWDTKKTQFQFEKLSSEEIAREVEKSKIVIDIQHPKQVGLTIRMIEMIGMGKRVITTNADIRNYDFYTPINISIIERKNPKLDLDIDKDYDPPREKIYKGYSLETWIYGVLGMEIGET